VNVRRVSLSLSAILHPRQDMSCFLATFLLQ
jgi:hypothetical protein